LGCGIISSDSLKYPRSKQDLSELGHGDSMRDNRGSSDLGDRTSNSRQGRWAGRRAWCRQLEAGANQCKKNRLGTLAGYTPLHKQTNTKIVSTGWSKRTKSDMKINRLTYLTPNKTNTTFVPTVGILGLARCSSHIRPSPPSIHSPTPLVPFFSLFFFFFLSTMHMQKRRISPTAPSLNALRRPPGLPRWWEGR
jgi:hypothetical protein